MSVLETTAREVEDDPVPFLAPLGPSPAQALSAALPGRPGRRPDPRPPPLVLAVTASGPLGHSGPVLPLWAVVRMNEFAQVSGG